MEALTFSCCLEVKSDPFCLFNLFLNWQHSLLTSSVQMDMLCWAQTFTPSILTRQLCRVVGFRPHKPEVWDANPNRSVGFFILFIFKNFCCQLPKFSIWKKVYWWGKHIANANMCWYGVLPKWLFPIHRYSMNIVTSKEKGTGSHDVSHKFCFCTSSTK